MFFQSQISIIFKSWLYFQSSDPTLFWNSGIFVPFWNSSWEKLYQSNKLLNERWIDWNLRILLFFWFPVIMDWKGYLGRTKIFVYHKLPSFTKLTPLAIENIYEVANETLEDCSAQRTNPFWYNCCVFDQVFLCF